MNTIIYTKHNDHAVVQFNRPYVRNAVNLEMMEELEFLLDEWEQTSNYKFILFRGDDKAFVSGGDLDQFHKLEKREDIEPVMLRMGKILERIHQLPMLTVAFIEGAAVGGGCELAVSCDWIVASPNAKLGMIQVKLGITTGWGGASRLMHKIGKSKALHMLLTGKRLSALEAKQIGLVDVLLDDPELSFEEQVAKWIRTYHSLPLLLIQNYKKLAQQVELGVSSEQLFPLESASCSILWESKEHREAVEHFLHSTRGRKEKN